LLLGWWSWAFAVVEKVHRCMETESAGFDHLPGDEGAWVTLGREGACVTAKKLDGLGDGVFRTAEFNECACAAGVLTHGLLSGGWQRRQSGRMAESTTSKTHPRLDPIRRTILESIDQRGEACLPHRKRR